jgi:hypothetical protein
LASTRVGELALVLPSPRAGRSPRGRAGVGFHE